MGKQSNGTSGTSGYTVTIDSNQNLYVGGNCSASTSFGGLSINGYGGFILKMSSEGDWVWLKGSISGIADMVCSSVQGSNYLFITGSFQGTAVFGNMSLYSNYISLYLAKMDSESNWIWARKADGSNDVYSISLVIDDNSKLVVTGECLETANFGSYSVSNYSGWDVFVASADSNGTWLSATNFGNSGNVYTYGSSIDSEGNSYVTGVFNAPLYIGDQLLQSNGDWDVFVTKYGYPQIEAAFSVNVTSGIQPLPVQFTDQSQQGSGPIVSWLWDFGDGNTSNLQNPSHTYLDAGVYDVSLTVTNSSDSASTLVREDYITVIDDEASILLQTSDHMNFGPIYIEEFSAVQTLTFTNNGSQPLTFTNSHLMGSPANFQYQIPGWDYTWEPGETGNIYIRFAPVEIGAITDTLVIVNNSANLPLLKISLSGTGLNVPPKPPDNVQIAMNGNDAVISWDAVTQNLHDQPITPDYYLVFYNGSSDPENGLYYYLWDTPGLSFSHHLVGLHAAYMFYRVVAYKYYGRGEFDISSLGLEPDMPEDEVLHRLTDIK